MVHLQGTTFWANTEEGQAKRQPAPRTNHTHPKKQTPLSVQIRVLYLTGNTIRGDTVEEEATLLDLSLLGAGLKRIRGLSALGLGFTPPAHQAAVLPLPSLRLLQLPPIAGRQLLSHTG